MIKNFTFQNFLSFKERTSFTLVRQSNDNSHKEAFFKAKGGDLLRSALIYGANASGKSNFSKALVFFQRFVTDGLKLSLANSPIQTVPFLLNTKTTNAPSFFEVEILMDDLKFVYGFEASQEKVHKEWLHQYPNKKVLFERTQDQIESSQRNLKEATADLKEKTRPNVLFLTVLASYNGEVSNKVVEEIKKITVFPADQKELILEYSFQNYAKYEKEIKEMIYEADVGIKDFKVAQKEVTKDEFVPPIFPEQLRDLLTAGQSKFVHRQVSTMHTKYDEKGNEIEDVPFDFFTQESAGTKQMFALSGLFVDALKEGKVLVIDELSASLHPFLCRYILKLFNSKEKNPKNAQLIFTTHDVSLLDSEILRRDQIWFAEKDKYGASQLFSLAALGERKDLNYSKRYFEGRYGALPYINSLETIDQL